MKIGPELSDMGPIATTLQLENVEMCKLRWESFPCSQRIHTDTQATKNAVCIMFIVIGAAKVYDTGQGQ